MRRPWRNVFGLVPKSLVSLFCLVMLLAHLLASIMSLGSVVVILAAISPRSVQPPHREPPLYGLFGILGLLHTLSLGPGDCHRFNEYADIWSQLAVLFSSSLCSVDFRLSIRCRNLFSSFSWANPFGEPSACCSCRLEAGETSDPDPDRHRGGHYHFGTLGVQHLYRSAIDYDFDRCCCLAVGSGRVPEMPSVFQLWWQDYLPRNPGPLCLFSSPWASFQLQFNTPAFAVRLTDFCAARQDLLGSLVLPLLPMSIVAFSLVGLHPFVSVLMVGPILAENDPAGCPPCSWVWRCLLAAASLICSPLCRAHPDSVPGAARITRPYLPAGKSSLCDSLLPACYPGHHPDRLNPVSDL